MLTNVRKAPFPFFGGKSQATELLWALLGDPAHYVTAFCGSCADLLRRPHPCNRPYHSETANDADGLLINALRALAFYPQETAEAASWYVAECVPAGTLIATPQGHVAIEALRPGMTIWGHDGTKVIPTTIQATNTHMTARPFIQIGSLRLTDNHPVWTAEDGYIPAGQLTASHHIATINQADILHSINGKQGDGTETVPLVSTNHQSSAKLLTYTMGEHAVLFSSLCSKRATPSRQSVSSVWEQLPPPRCHTDALWKNLYVSVLTCARQALCHLWKTISCSAWQQDAGMLFDFLCTDQSRQQPQRDISRNGETCLEATRGPSSSASVFAFGPQSYTLGSGTAQRTSNVTQPGIPVFSAWRESAPYKATSLVSSDIRMENRSGCKAESTQRTQSYWTPSCYPSLPVYTRYRQYSPTDCDRSGWELASLSAKAKARYQTRYTIASPWMDGSTLHQYRNSHQLASDTSTDQYGCRVYNLETTSGNYFAHNILVHNCDLMARHLALLAWVKTEPLEHMMADPTYCDPEKAGWWLWGLSAWIGSGWCSGSGPWVVHHDTGRIERQAGARSLGRQPPHLTDNGRGVNHAGTREPGVSRQRPHLTSNGQGVSQMGTREPGVSRRRPHLSDNGQGVNRPGTREPGIAMAPTETPIDLGALTPYQALIEADYAATGGFHPMTMPELRRWFDALSARLRHVRILHGDYPRVLTHGALNTLSVRENKGCVGIFLDPPYRLSERDPGIYRHDATASRDLAAECRAWCLEHGQTPNYRIVLAGFAGEGHEVLLEHGWREYAWFRHEHLTGGLGNIGGTGQHQQARERFWASPHCRHETQQVRQMEMFLLG